MKQTLTINPRRHHHPLIYDEHHRNPHCINETNINLNNFGPKD
jgi:hypothetical protein